MITPQHNTIRCFYWIILVIKHDCIPVLGDRGRFGPLINNNDSVNQPHLKQEIRWGNNERQQFNKHEYGLLLECFECAEGLKLSSSNAWSLFRHLLS